MTFYATSHLETHGFAPVAVCCIAALPLIAIRYADVLRLLRAILRGIGVVVLVLVLFDAFGSVAPAPNVIFGAANDYTLFFRWGRLIAVIVGAAAGVLVTGTDFLSMPDAGVFGGVIAVVAASDWTLNRFPTLKSMMANMPLDVLRRKISSQVPAVIVGAHLGDYLCSGLAQRLAPLAILRVRWLLLFHEHCFDVR